MYYYKSNNVLKKTQNVNRVPRFLLLTRDAMVFLAVPAPRLHSATCSAAQNGSSAWALPIGSTEPTTSRSALRQRSTRMTASASASTAAQSIADSTDTDTDSERAPLRLSGLWQYPLKGGVGVSLTHAALTREGLAGDRRFMVSTIGGQFVTARTNPKLSTIFATIDRGGRLSLRCDGRALNLSVPIDRPTTTATVWGQDVAAVDMGDHAARWLTDVLGGHPGSLLGVFGVPSYRLLHARERSRRRSGFADMAPFHLICKETLDDLASRWSGGGGGGGGGGSGGGGGGGGAAASLLGRFRPNMVVSGCMPYEEDRWCALRIGEATFTVDGLCPRCTVPDVDPVKTERERAKRRARRRAREKGERETRERETRERETRERETRVGRAHPHASFIHAHLRTDTPSGRR